MLTNGEDIIYLKASVKLLLNFPYLMHQPDLFMDIRQFLVSLSVCSLSLFKRTLMRYGLVLCLP